MKNIKRLSESQLNRIVKSVISEIAAPQMPQAPQNDRMSKIIAEIEREGYEAKNRGDMLYVKFSKNGGAMPSKSRSWSRGISMSDAQKFYNLVSKIINDGFRFDNIVPTQGGVVFIFTDMGGFTIKDMY